MIRSLLLTTFFCFFSVLSIAQDRKVLDSLNNAFKKTAVDTTKIILLNDIAFQYRNVKPDTTISISQQAIALAESRKYERGKAWAIHHIGLALVRKGQLPAGLENFKESQAIFEQLGDKKGIAANLNHIGNIYNLQGNFTMSMDYYLKSKKLREEVKDYIGVAASLNNIGLVYQYQGNFPMALETYLNVLKVRETYHLNDKMGNAITYNNIGNIYQQQQQLSQALNYHQQSLKLREEINDKQGVGNSLHNIGIIYNALQKEEIALTYFEKALKIREEIKDKQGLAANLVVLGNTYSKRKQYDKAKEYLDRSLVLHEEIKDKRGFFYSLSGLATCYNEQSNFEKALEYGEKALKAAQEMRAKPEERDALQVLYSIYKSKGDYDNALRYHELFKRMNDTIFNVEKSKSIANLESVAALEKKQREVALLEKDKQLNQIEAEKKARELEITKKQAEAERLMALARQEKDKRKADSLEAASQKATLEADKLRIQEEKTNAEREKLLAEAKAKEIEIENAKKEKEQQQLINYLVIAGLFSVTVFLVYVFISRQKIQKANTLLAQQNEEILQHEIEIASKNETLRQNNEELKQQQEELLMLNDTLENQKQKIETTYTQLKFTTEQLNKSIKYASEIQGVILPEEADLRNFFSDFFAIYQPKDVVSGDFYWFSQTSATTGVFVMADCTGHGVPGAFMSMLGSTLLHETINIKGVTNDPARILRNLHAGLRNVLHQDKGKNKDGMDISVCFFEKRATEKQIEFIFSGAKSIMYFITNGELTEVRGDKQYIGGRPLKQEFQNQAFTLPMTTTFYLFTDGFADQNDEHRNKLGYNLFRETIKKHSHWTFAEQQKGLLNLLQLHQQNEEQRDDISVVGLRFV